MEFEEKKLKIRRYIIIGIVAVLVLIFIISLVKIVKKGEAKSSNFINNLQVIQYQVLKYPLIYQLLL